MTDCGRCPVGQKCTGCDDRCTTQSKTKQALIDAIVDRHMPLDPDLPLNEYQAIMEAREKVARSSLLDSFSIQELKRILNKNKAH